VRVLILSSRYREPASRDKLRALVGLGVEVVAVIAGGSAHLDGGIRIVPVPVRGSTERSSRRWSPRTVKRLLAELRPDLVHIEEEPDTQLAAVGAALATRARIPYVLASAESLALKLGFWQRRRVARVATGLAGLIGASSPARARLAEWAPDVPAATIPLAGTPVPPPISREPAAALAIGFAGRLVPERGLDLVVRALANTYGHWTLTVLGTGPEQERAEELIERLGLASRVRWLGGIRPESIEAFWPAIDCLVVASRDTPTWVDGHSPVLLQAMGRGITPIVTRAGALPEIVGEAGLIVDDAERLAEALQQLVAAPAKCRSLGASARQRVLEQFTSDAVAARTLELWTRVLSGREAASRAP